MKINVHAGHNPDGMKGCGAVGIKFESTQNRIVAGALINMLREAGHTVYDCTVDDGVNARDVLCKIVEKCNAHTADIDVSIHHNAFKMDETGDGKIKGTEVYVYSDNSKAVPAATRIMNEIGELGFPKRGVQAHPELYVLKHTKAPALLVECCFIDDRDDMNIYDPHAMAAAIMKGLTGDIPAEIAPETTKTGAWYKIQIGAYKNRELAEKRLKTIRETVSPDAFIQVYD